MYTSLHAGIDIETSAIAQSYLNCISNRCPFQSVGIERHWWRLFQKRAVRTKFDIYVFIYNTVCIFVTNVLFIYAWWSYHTTIVIKLLFFAILELLHWLIDWLIVELILEFLCFDWLKTFELINMRGFTLNYHDEHICFLSLRGEV